MSTLLIGIAPEHAAGFLAGLVALLIVPFLRGGSSSLVDRWAAALLGYAGAVHLFLPFGHPATPLMITGYVLSGLAFGALAWRAHVGRGWRIGTAILAPLTVLAYLINGEDPDQVGILTMLLELTAFGLAVATTRRVGRVFGSVATVFAVFLAGAVSWIASFQAHQGTTADSQNPAVGHGHVAEGGHEHLARAQAGVIMRPLGDNHHATADQTAAAIALAAATKQSVARFGSLDEALAAGYQYSDLQETGMNVHLEHGVFKDDGVLLDPQKPEQLVFAIEDGKATLMGVVFVMEKAGDPGIAPGGPLTRWHAHNVCVSLLPPGVGIVTPYGSCPSFSITVTIPEMMHVWTVEPPGGPFAEAIEETWARDYLRQHGR
jgi:hypothetical protein